MRTAQCIENYLIKKNQLLNILLLPIFKLFRLHTCLVQHFKYALFAPNIAPDCMILHQTLSGGGGVAGHAPRPP